MVSESFAMQMMKIRLSPTSSDDVRIKLPFLVCNSRHYVSVLPL